MRPGTIRRLVRDQEGAVAVMLALALPMVLGMMTLGVEFGLWFAERRSLQTAADAGALSGAFELTAGRKTTVTAAATTDARKNGFIPGTGSVIAVRYPPTTGAYAGNSSAVEVVVSRQQALLLANVFLSSQTVAARAVAKMGTPGDYCVLSLDPHQGVAVDVTGSATINLANCGVVANSDSAQAISVSGSADLYAKYVQAVGGYDVSGSGNMVVDSVITGASAVADPYASLAIPSYGGCTKNNYTSHGTETLSPGVYCGGMSFNANTNVTLSPGTYIVKGSTFKVNGQATITGSGVTIILTGSSGNYAQVDINGGATVNLSAPTSGTYAGVTFFQDHNAPSGGDNKFNGGANMQVNGVMYFPNQEVDFSGNNSTAANACARIVARLVKFTGNADMGDKCTGTGVASGAATPPTLVE